MIASGSELAFLLDLLLEHKLSSTTKAALVARIKHVEANLVLPQALRAAPVSLPAVRQAVPASPEAQTLAASLAAQANADVEPSQARGAYRAPTAEAIPAAAVGVTSAAADAMAQRNRLIAEAQAGIAKKGPAVGRGHGTK